MSEYKFNPTVSTLYVNIEKQHKNCRNITKFKLWQIIDAKGQRSACHHRAHFDPDWHHHQRVAELQTGKLGSEGLPKTFASNISNVFLTLHPWCKIWC